METTLKTKGKKARKRVPRVLIYEMRYRSPIYYRDYDKVLSGEKQLEEVMGSSGLQSWLIDLIVRFLHVVLNPKNYQILLSEVGYKFAPKSWYNLDIGIWEKEKVKPFLKKDKMVPVAPKVVYIAPL
jgi:hypothetical protein